MNTKTAKYRLTPSQHEILGLLAAEELTAREIADRLERHIKTIRNSLRKLYSRNLVKVRIADDGIQRWRFII